MENFTRRVAGWLLLCLAMSVSLSASAQQPPVERSDVETVPVQDDPEEMVVESRPEDTNRSKSEKEDDTDDDEDEDDDRTSAVRKDVGRDERVGKEERSENDRKVTRATIEMTMMMMMTMTKEFVCRPVLKYRQLRERRRSRKKFLL